MPTAPLATEREYIHQFNEADTPEKLTELLRDLSPEQERALRNYLGPDRFRRLYVLAQTTGASRAMRALEGNVLVVHGIMGSELTVSDMAQHQTLVWLSLPRIYLGWLSRLRLDAAGKNPFDADYTAEASNILNKYYGELVLHLSRRWKVRAFWYDWRRGLRQAAAELENRMRHEEFGGEPVRVVAHSMGGLVARTLLLKDPRTEKGDPLLQRLVMLGTPNFGSFEVPQIFAGIQDTVRQLAKLTGGLGGLLNSRPAQQRLLEILDSFPGIYQMMPWPAKVAADQQALVEQLYKPSAYAAFNNGVSAEHLDAARKQMDKLNATIASKERLVYVAGYGELTVVGLKDIERLTEPDGYNVSKAGDGRVPHALGILPGVPTYYVRAAHGDLARNYEVLGAIDDLIESGKTNSLPDELPDDRALRASPEAMHAEWKRRFEENDRRQSEEVVNLLQRFERRGLVSRGLAAEISVPAEFHGDEREMEEHLVEPFLGAAPTAAPIGPKDVTAPPKIMVRLAHANIADCHENEAVQQGLDVDALAAGVYTGVMPCGALLALDRSISMAPAPAPDAAPPSHLLLCELIQRGTVRGDLGAPFLLPDPRDGGRRIIALAGLGAAGTCGIPELALAIRELCWTLNSLGTRHLATLLIGAGQGNLSIPEAIEGYLRGVARALNSAASAGTPGVAGALQRITFVELHGRRLQAIAEALQRTQQQLRAEQLLDIDYTFTEAEAEEYHRLEVEEEERHLQEELQKAKRPKPRAAISEVNHDRPPARITFALTDGVYTFGAVTEDASIPERSVEVNSLLVNQTNDLLVQATTVEKQWEYGSVLAHELIPRDLRAQFRPGAPLVMQMDARAARIHWEMVASGTGGSRKENSFLGLERGFTRQLRTAFAPPPEPPPSARRTLRVLVIADPAPDARLPGALLEAEEVAQLFEAFNQVYGGEVRTEVTRMFGPSEANWIEVLARLFLDETFDVLHYAGHCFFDARDPASCGWVFRDRPRQVLSARELRLVDLVPRFVFSNACESGVTPDRPECRQADMAPSFAEAFFERGVANFICTAWPVDDTAARVFARHVYAGLLGLEVARNKPELDIGGGSEPLPLYRALREARTITAVLPSGIQTWGAYQHYGNPHARFFAQEIERHARPHFRKTSAATMPAAPSPTASAASPPAPPSGVDRFASVRAAIAAHGDRLRQPGVLEVRPGFKYTKGWSTGQPAIVVVVRKKLPVEEVPQSERLPEEVDGIPVDVAPATPLEQLGGTTRGLRSDFPDAEPLLVPGERMIPAEAAERRLPYQPPNGVQLEEINDAMTVTCHVSPDHGWEMLKAFLGQTEHRLTVGMYDFSAPHIEKRLKQVLRPAGREMQLVLDPGLSLGAPGEDGESNPKAHDMTEDDIKEDLETQLKKRFKFVWAAVKHKGKVTEGIFPTSYHIKLAVRDGDVFWLSSGNWQSSNQPSDETLEAIHASWDDPITVLSVCNREWHVIIEHEKLASIFETFLQHDFEEAEPLQATVEERGMEEPLPELFLPPPPAEELAQRRLRNLKRFESEEFVFRGTKKLRVQPLLTPDNYAEHVLKLIESARKSLYFQNQYINLSARPDRKFLQLIDALKAMLNDRRIDVRIILRDLPGSRKMLEALESEGFDMRRIRLQRATHTKGIIVDDEMVLLGSHNWSSFGTTQNRDASLIFFDPGITGYYKKIFLHDWDGLASSRVSGERAMPLIAGTERGDSTMSQGWIRVPWEAVYED